MIVTERVLKNKFLIIAIIILILTMFIVYGIGREKKLVIKFVQDEIVNKSNTNLPHLNKHKLETKYLIKDIDNYGRNWTVYAENQNSNVLIFSVHSERGVGPIPFMNSLLSLVLTNIEEQDITNEY